MIGKEYFEWDHPLSICGAVLDARIVVPGVCQKAYAAIDFLTGCQEKGAAEILSTFIPMTDEEKENMELFGVGHDGYEANSFFPSERFFVDKNEEMQIRRARREAPRFYYDEWAKAWPAHFAPTVILKYKVMHRVDTTALREVCREARYEARFDVWVPYPARRVKGKLWVGNKSYTTEGIKRYMYLAKGEKLHLLPPPRRAVKFQYKYVK